MKHSVLPKLPFVLFLGLALSVAAPPQHSSAAELKLAEGDKIVVIGNGFAERMQYYPHFETLLQSRFPELKLSLRNLGWSADELDLRPRSKDFDDHNTRLIDHQPDVVIASFGFNESFAGYPGLKKFEENLEKFIQETTTTKYNGESAPQLVLIGPMAHENLHRRTLPSGEENNKSLKVYSDSMAKLAEQHGVVFVDLFESSQPVLADTESDLTINGVHLDDAGYKAIAPLIDAALFGPRPENVQANMDDLYKIVAEKALLHWYDHRAINGYYIYGGRKNPFGVVNFPPEFAKLRKMIANRDEVIWSVAAGNPLPEKIDDSNTGEFANIETNFKRPIKIVPPEKTLDQFKLPEGYEINLFASETDFPELMNPCQIAFDAQGRLWVATMPTYPQVLPGEEPTDKLLVFEDTNGDGKADKQTVFADNLHIPTGFELGDGGVYVAQQPNLVFLKDTNGDGKADHREIRLMGFDSADSHHSISAFTWGPGGALYFQEGTFHHTQTETPYGPERCKDAGVFRYEPLTEKFDVFVSYSFANPWGHVFDKWGQNFVADASPGKNYYGTAFSGDVDYPRKHPGMKTFLEKQWRPTSGCEIVASSNFPDKAQGNFLLNNCIGFQGVLQYKMKEEGSGFTADPVEPLLKSSDPNFRPVDLEFGPDGALYICDWYNPLVGHMQHSIRDPKRDTSHGRIYRIHYKDRPLVEPAQIAEASIPELLELLTSYEDRTRYRVRRELRERDAEEVAAALEKWLAELDQSDENYELYRLEGLWIYQNLEMPNLPLLEQVLRSPDYHARAAATRVLCYWRDQVENPLELLQPQVNDEHPRVRLEAIRALSFFDSQAALDLTLESLAYEQDYYLEYCFKETLKTLEGRIGE